MTTHPLPDGRTVLFVPVPDRARYFNVENDSVRPWLEYYVCVADSDIEDLPPGTWTLIGTSDAMSEEQAAKVVELGRGFMPGAIYKLHGGADYWATPSATESLASLLTYLNLTGRHAVLLK